MTYPIPYLPQEASSKIALWEKRGYFATVKAFEPLPSECKNCVGFGLVYVNFLGGGPYKVPVGIRRPSTYFEGDGRFRKGWYTIEETVAFPCPECNHRGG